MNIKSSGNKKTNKPDIKPLRSEVFSNFKRNNAGGGLLMIYLIGTINLIGVILLATWFFNTSGNQQEAGQGLIQRLSILEEKIENQININKELVSSLDEDVEFINKEIRKLWDLSNKKNRRNIQIQTSQIKDLSIKDNNQVYLFNGWTFTSSPTLRSIDHPVYDLWITSCENI